MSLYRKYRPQTFEDMVGQEHIAQTLRNALSSDPIRIAHAYLFCGPRGTGKTTSARLLAKCLNCEQGPTPTPCNECDFCTRVRDNQTTMDLVEIDAASNTGVDNVRESIIDKVNSAPAQGRYRIYIIDEVHMLSTSSFNALLKTLEEPPAHAVFVLATTDAHKVPPTISSRCQRFDFRRVGPNDIIKRLQYVAKCEGINLGEDAARLIAFTADGALRDALTLLEQVTAFSAETISEADVRLVLGTVSRELMDELVDAVGARDANAALQAIERATEEGVSFSQLTRDLVSYCRDLLLLTVGFSSDGALSDAEKKRRHHHAQQLGRARLTSCIEALRAAEKEMRQSTDNRLLLELTLVRQTASAAQESAPVFAAPRLVTAQAAPAQPQVQTPQVQTPQVQTPQVQTPQAQAPQAQAPQLQKPQLEAPRMVVPQAPTTPVAANGALHEYSDNDSPNGAIKNVELNGAASIQADSASTDAPSDSEIKAPLEAAAHTIWHAPTQDASDAAPDVEVASQDISQDSEPSVEAVSPHMSTHVAEDAATNDAEAAPETSSPEAIAPRKKGRRIGNLDEFNELWPAVLARVKRKIGVSAVAYLHDAQPIALDEKEAVLEFQKEFHFEKACEAAKRLPFEQVVNECLAAPHILRFRLKPPPDAAAAPPSVAAPPPDDDDDGEDDVLRLAQDMFGAEVVGRSGEG